MPSIQITNETEDEDMDQDTPQSHTLTDCTTMNQNLRQKPRMKKVQANHPIIDSRASRT